jgi:uncharacterized phage-associated protein
MPYDSKAVANYFLDLANNQSRKIDPMQMQKLVYFAHGWCLGLKDVPLVAEKIEAWRYGPVIRELYTAFRDAGSGPITHPAYEVVVRDGKFYFHAPTLDTEEDDGQLPKDVARPLVEEVWKVYGGFSAIQLSNLTHEPGTPWHETWNSSRGANAVISDDLMARYFKGLAERA